MRKTNFRRKMSHLRQAFGNRRMIPFFVVTMVGLIGLVGLIIMGLWNWIMPAVFGLGLISIWQALGMLILGRLLFGGFRRHRFWGYKRRYAHAYCRTHNHNNFGNTKGEDTIVTE
jgi:hypothetical protein